MTNKILLLIVLINKTFGLKIIEQIPISPSKFTTHIVMKGSYKTEERSEEKHFFLDYAINLPINTRSFQIVEFENDNDFNTALGKETKLFQNYITTIASQSEPKILYPNNTNTGSGYWSVGIMQHYKTDESKDQNEIAKLYSICKTQCKLSYNSPFMVLALA